MIKRHNSEKRKANFTKAQQTKAQATDESRSSTGKDVAQAHAATDQRRVVARRAS
jgi:hypothetical protein